MAKIERLTLPEYALLQRYACDGNYTDCYSTTIPGTTSLTDFVSAFYTTRLFKAERVILDKLASRPSTDEQAQHVAAGEVDEFAAWSVEDRARDQLLMCDMHERTRSWFMVVPVDGDDDGDSVGDATQLFFGSAVIAIEDQTSGKRSLGFLVNALMGFHKLYSRLLLKAARRRLMASARSPGPRQEAAR